MSVLDTINWGLPVSYNYKIWWQIWGGKDEDSPYRTSVDRDKLSKKVMDILDSDPERYRIMIEAGSIHSMAYFEPRVVPEEYSLKSCMEAAERLLKRLMDVAENCTHVQIELTQTGNGGEKVIPAVAVHFDTVPFGYCLPQRHSRYTFHIFPINHEFKHYNDLIPNYCNLPKVRGARIPSLSTRIQNF